MDAVVLQWQAHVSHFKYFPHLPEENQITLVDKVLERHSKDLQDWQIVLSGPFDMALSMRDALVQQGVLVENLFSDAFTT